MGAGEIRFENVTVTGGRPNAASGLRRGAQRGVRLDVRSLSASSGQTAIEGKGTVRASLQRLDGTFDFTSKLLERRRRAGVAHGARSSGVLIHTLREPARRRRHRLRVRAQVVAKAKVDKARALGYPNRMASTTSIDLQGATLTANPLRFELYGGRYDSTLVLDLSSDRTVLDHRATLTGANVATLAQLLGHPGAATGSLNLTMHVRGAGKDLSAAAQTVQGAATSTCSTVPCRASTWCDRRSWCLGPRRRRMPASGSTR